VKANNLHLPTHLFVECFEKTVLPVCLYGCEIWAPEPGITEKVNVFVRNTLRTILRLSSDSARVMLYNEFGISSAEDLICCRALSYWFKLVNGKQTKLSYILYKFMLNRYNGKQTGENSFELDWFDYIRHQLIDLGLMDNWRAQERQTITLTAFTNMVKTQIEARYRKWC